MGKGAEVTPQADISREHRGQGFACWIVNSVVSCNAPSHNEGDPLPDSASSLGLLMPDRHQAIRNIGRPDLIHALGTYVEKHVISHGGPPNRGRPRTVLPSRRMDLESLRGSRYKGGDGAARIVSFRDGPLVLQRCLSDLGQCNDRLASEPDVGLAAIDANTLAPVSRCPALRHRLYQEAQSVAATTVAVATRLRHRSNEGGGEFLGTYHSTYQSNDEINRNIQPSLGTTISLNSNCR